MKTLLAALALLVAFAPFLPAADDPVEKRREIELYMALTGESKMRAQMLSTMLPALKAKAPNAPAHFWEIYVAKVNARANELNELIIPTYDKYFTLEDLKALNAFYQTPTGRKVVTQAPQLAKDVGEIARGWSVKVAAEAMAEAQHGGEK